MWRTSNNKALQVVITVFILFNFVENFSYPSCSCIIGLKKIYFLHPIFKRVINIKLSSSRITQMKRISFLHHTAKRIINTKLSFSRITQAKRISFSHYTIKRVITVWIPHLPASQDRREFLSIYSFYSYWSKINHWDPHRNTFERKQFLLSLFHVTTAISFFIVGLCGN